MPLSTVNIRLPVGSFGNVVSFSFLFFFFLTYLLIIVFVTKVFYTTPEFMCFYQLSGCIVRCHFSTSVYSSVLSLLLYCVPVSIKHIQLSFYNFTCDDKEQRSGMKLISQVTCHNRRRKKEVWHELV